MGDEYRGGGADDDMTGEWSEQNIVPPTGRRQAVHNGFPQVLQKDATGSSG